MTIDPKILGKIKKCLALGQSPEPHEAAAAMRQAQRLMELHGVDQETIDLQDIGEASFDGYTVTKIRRWEACLVSSVARAFGCKVVQAVGHGRIVCSYTYIGTKDKAQLAAYTGQVLYRQCLRARAQWLQINVPASTPRGDKARLGDDFCLGWAVAVDKKVVEFAMPEGLRALVDQYAKERLNAKGKTTAKDTGREVSGAYTEGKEAAKDAYLHRPMEGQTQRRLA